MDNFERLRASSLLQKRLAKYIVRFCFRDNTILEELHADPDSRISQAEMRTLMIGAVQNCYTFIGFLLNVYDGRPGLRDLMAGTALTAGMAAGNTTPITNLLDALESCDFNPEWSEPKDGGERVARRRQDQGRKKK